MTSILIAVIWDVAISHQQDKLAAAEHQIKGG
jgi:hypothetical protein